MLLHLGGETKGSGEDGDAISGGHPKSSRDPRGHRGPTVCPGVTLVTQEVPSALRYCLPLPSWRSLGLSSAFVSLSLDWGKGRGRSWTG